MLWRLAYLQCCLCLCPADISAQCVHHLDKLIAVKLAIVVKVVLQQYVYAA
jgi:hypothetical protein